MAKDKPDLTKTVGTAHPTIQAVDRVNKTVYPVYQDLNSVGKVAAFTIIKGGEVRGPFVDAVVARDTAQYLLDLDRERGIVNP